VVDLLPDADVLSFSCGWQEGWKEIDARAEGTPPRAYGQCGALSVFHLLFVQFLSEESCLFMRTIIAWRGWFSA